MKRVLLVGLLLASQTALADTCYTRVQANLKKMGVTTTARDSQQMVVPDDLGKKCIVRYRIDINGQWRTVEGQGVGKNETEACRQAYSPASAYFLVDVEPTQVSADTQMVCTDRPEIRVRPVRIGEVVWETETDLHPHPDERKYFEYKHSQCRLFFERSGKGQNLFTYQGVICRIDRTTNSKWKVIDKY